MAKASPGTEVVGLTPAFGAAGVDSNAQSLIASVGVMDAVLRYGDPYDAVVVGGFGEHGREGLQELVEVPVLDIAECAAHVAMMLGRTFSVVTTLQRSVAQVEDRLLLAGLTARCASVRAVGLATRELDDDPAAADLADHRGGPPLCRRRPRRGAGARLRRHGRPRRRSCPRRVGVPVVDGVTAAIAVAESLVRLGLRTSNVGSTAPPDLSATTWPIAPLSPGVADV